MNNLPSCCNNLHYYTSSLASCLGVYSGKNKPVTRRHDCSRLPASAERTYMVVLAYLAAAAIYKPGQKMWKAQLIAVIHQVMTAAIFYSLWQWHKWFVCADDYWQVEPAAFLSKEVKVRDWDREVRLLSNICLPLSGGSPPQTAADHIKNRNTRIETGLESECVLWYKCMFHLWPYMTHQYSGYSYVGRTYSYLYMKHYITIAQF